MYSNSEEENAVYVYSVAAGKVVQRLTGEHHAIVRGVAATEIAATLLLKSDSNTAAAAAADDDDDDDDNNNDDDENDEIERNSGEGKKGNAVVPLLATASYDKSIILWT